jgi:hypothetical protein
MTELRGRALIESRFGLLTRTDHQAIVIAGREWDLFDLLVHMGLNFDDSKPIDVQTTGDHYVVRYYDGQDQRVVAHEFDADFKFIAETRAHIAEWIGEDAYFSLYSGH